MATVLDMTERKGVAEAAIDGTAGSLNSGEASNSFAMVPIWLVRAVSPSALELYIRLSVTRDPYWPGVAAIATIIGSDKDKARRLVNELVQAGALEITRTVREDGGTGVNIYTIRVTRAPVLRLAEATDPLASDTPRGVKNHPPTPQNCQGVNGQVYDLNLNTSGVQGGGSLSSPSRPPSFPPHTPPNHPPTHLPAPAHDAPAHADTGTRTGALTRTPPPPTPSSPRNGRKIEREPLDVSWASGLPQGEPWAVVARLMAEAIAECPKYATVTIQPTLKRARKLAEWMLEEAPNQAAVRAFLMEWGTKNSGDEMGRYGDRDPLGCISSWAKSRMVRGEWIVRRNEQSKRASAPATTVEERIRRTTEAMKERGLL